MTIHEIASTVVYIALYISFKHSFKLLNVWVQLGDTECSAISNRAMYIMYFEEIFEETGIHLLLSRLSTNCTNERNLNISDF